jgi:hypothetical protein
MERSGGATMTGMILKDGTTKNLRQWKNCKMWLVMETGIFFRTLIIQPGKRNENITISILKL